LQEIPSPIIEPRKQNNAASSGQSNGAAGVAQVALKAGTRPQFDFDSEFGDCEESILLALDQVEIRHGQQRLHPPSQQQQQQEQQQQQQQNAQQQQQEHHPSGHPQQKHQSAEQQKLKPQQQQQQQAVLVEENRRQRLLQQQQQQQPPQQLQQKQRNMQFQHSPMGHNQYGQQQQPLMQAGGWQKDGIIARQQPLSHYPAQDSQMNQQQHVQQLSTMNGLMAVNAGAMVAAFGQPPTPIPPSVANIVQGSAQNQMNMAMNIQYGTLSFQKY